MDILIIILLLVIAAEVTYLLARSQAKGVTSLSKQSPIFVDTSVLIDGRIVAIAQSGFIARPLYIPRSVVGELQYLADNSDTEKRTRARHGLDVINILQSIESVEVVIFADGVRAEEGVDNRLLELSTKHNGALCTIDYNLNKVAAVQGIQVLNVNELAKSLRMAYLPGEKLRIELTQKGNEQHQAVGHLEDGTMVVVEHAHRQIGTIAEVEFIRSLQTAAGKMMFAKLVETVPGSRSQVRQASKQKPAVKSDKPEVKASPKPTAQKSAGRKPVEKTAQAAVSTRAARPAASRTPRRRKSPEDSLVELANSQ